MTNLILTKEGLENLQKEYKNLREVNRPAAVARLQSARSMGDLSENSEYSAAKEELALIDERLQEIQVILKTAKVAEDNHNDHEVSLGSKVQVETAGLKDTFHLVGE